MQSNPGLYAELPQPTRPLAELHLAADMVHTLGIATLAGIGTALGSGLLVLALTMLQA